MKAVTVVVDFAPFFFFWTESSRKAGTWDDELWPLKTRLAQMSWFFVSSGSDSLETVNLGDDPRCNHSTTLWTVCFDSSLLTHGRVSSFLSEAGVHLIPIEEERKDRNCSFWKGTTAEPLLILALVFTSYRFPDNFKNVPMNLSSVHSTLCSSYFK